MNLSQISLNLMKNLRPISNALAVISQAKPQKSLGYQKEIKQAAQRHQVSPILLTGILNYFAQKKDTSQNLMQLTLQTARHLGVKNRNQASENINGAARYLHSLMDRFSGDPQKALAAYFSGPSKVEKYQGVPPSKAAKNFINQVLNYGDTSFAKLAQSRLKQVENNRPPTLSSAKLALGELGVIAEKYESGGRGVNTISSGRADPGGVSYGAYQLSSRAGTMAAFLRSSEAESFAESFQNLKPGTRSFNEVYRQVAKNDSETFAKAQKDFILRTHYHPVLKEATKLGFNVENRGIQEALFSASLQHSRRGVFKILRKTAWQQDLAKLSVRKQIQNLYEARAQYARRFASAAATTQRYIHEVKEAIGLSKVS